MISFLAMMETIILMLVRAGIPHMEARATTQSGVLYRRSRTMGAIVCMARVESRNTEGFDPFQAENVS